MKIEIPSKREDIKDERYFQIRDVDSKGCGRFQTFCVSPETTQQEIGEIAADIWTQEMIGRENSYRPMFYNNPPKWRETIKVVEQKRDTETLLEPDKKGRDFRNLWTTKKKGLKFTIVNNWIRIKMTSGETREGNGYSFGKLL